MKFNLFLSGGLAAGVLLTVSFYPTTDAGLNPPPRGTKTLYIPEDSTASPLPPAGYSPYFINYVGRHGARHVTNLKELSALAHFLHAAAASGDLTVPGDSLEARVGRLLEVEKQYTPGDLTQRGRDEQAGIGRRMREHYPQLFSNAGDCLNISYTEEARTRQSSESFLQALLPAATSAPLTPSSSSKLSVSSAPVLSARAAASTLCIHINPSDSIRLRFFDLAPRYKIFSKKGPWTAALDRLLQDPNYLIQLNAMVNRWFVPAFAKKLLTDLPAESMKTEKKGIDGAQALAEAVYGAASITGGLEHEIAACGFTPDEVNIFGLLSEKETRWLALTGGVKDFLVKGPGIDPDGIQVRDAVPLLADLLRTTDSSILHANGGADLRFAHAETIAPLAAILELEGASTPDTDLLHYPDAWKVDHIIPFSANIQWVLYRGGDVPVLVKILYNERAVHLPIPAASFPYYRYKDVKSFYLEKLKRLHIDLNQDMYTYLQNLK